MPSSSTFETQDIKVSFSFAGLELSCRHLPALHKGLDSIPQPLINTQDPTSQQSDRQTNTRTWKVYAGGF